MKPPEKYRKRSNFGRYAYDPRPTLPRKSDLIPEFFSLIMRWCQWREAKASCNAQWPSIGYMVEQLKGTRVYETTPVCLVMERSTAPKKQGIMEDVNNCILKTFDNGNFIELLTLFASIPFCEDKTERKKKWTGTLKLYGVSGNRWRDKLLLLQSNLQRKGLL